VEKIMKKTNYTSRDQLGMEQLDAVSQLTDDELGTVSGGTYTKQKPDGTSAGNVAAKWNLVQGAAA
jgi:hypothetical protein